MIQRAIGVTVGAIVTLVLLVLFADVSLDRAIAPVVIGAVAAWAWPVVIAFWLGRRAKQRRNDQFDAEVTRQVNQQTKR